MKTIITQSLKWHLRGCLSRDEVYHFLDSMWKPTRLVNVKIRHLKVIRFVDLLHRDRISLNRIIRIEVGYEYPTIYVIQLWFYTRRGNECYCGYAVSR